MTDKDFDFGFSFDDDHSTTLNTKDEKIQQLRTALANVCALIGPLLTNLKREPDKPTIYWPNRVERIEAFEYQIENTVRGALSK